MPKLHLHPIGVICIVVGILSWIVALAGLAASTKFCSDLNDPDTISPPPPTMPFPPPGSPPSNDTSAASPPSAVAAPPPPDLKINLVDELHCAHVFQLEWWAIMFEIIILLAMLGTCFLNAFERARYIYLTYVIMATFFLTVMSKKFITNSFRAGGFDFQDYNKDAYNAAAAGAIMLCMTNYALIVFIGLSATTDLSKIQVPGMSRLGLMGLTTQQHKYQVAEF